MVQQDQSLSTRLGNTLQCGKTGWPAPPLAQDNSRKLFRWFAERLGSRRLVREACAEIARRPPVSGT